MFIRKNSDTLDYCAYISDSGIRCKLYRLQHHVWQDSVVSCWPLVMMEVLVLLMGCFRLAASNPGSSVLAASVFVPGIVCLTLIRSVRH